MEMEAPSEHGDDPEIETVSVFLRTAHDAVVQSCLVRPRTRRCCYRGLTKKRLTQEQVSDMKVKIAKHYEETWAEKESEYKEKIEKQEVCGHAAFGIPTSAY